MHPFDYEAVTGVSSGGWYIVLATKQVDGARELGIFKRNLDWPEPGFSVVQDFKGSNATINADLAMKGIRNDVERHGMKGTLASIIGRDGFIGPPHLPQVWGRF